MMQLPLFEQLTVNRVSFALDGLVGVLMLLGWVHLGAVLRQRATTKNSVVALVLTSVIAFALLPIVVAQPFPLASSTVGQAKQWVTFFGKYLGHGQRVLFFPYPSPPPGMTSQIVWQAEAKYSYEILGGYFATPSEPGTASNFAVPPKGEEGALIQTGSEFAPAPLRDFKLDLIANAINHRHPTTIVVLPTLRYSAQYAAVVTALLGRLPGVKGPILVWRDVTHATYHQGDKALIAKCLALPATLSLKFVPVCVLKGQHARHS